MRGYLAGICAGLLVLVGCDGGVTPPPEPPRPPAIDAQLRRAIGQWGVVPIVPMTAPNAALVDLGQALMFDKILSGNRDISCATCHHPSIHGTDGLSLAIGTGGTGLGPSRTLGQGREFVPRNAPSMLNQGLRPVYIFWDGRISGHGSGPFSTPSDVKLPAGLTNIVAAQAMLPVLNRREMRGEPGDLDMFGNPNELAQFPDSQYVEIWQALMRRLLAIPEYVAKFGAAFPGIAPEALQFRHGAEAIAAFVMHGFARYDSPFDRYLARDDQALTPGQKRGALLFFGGRARCAQCHAGPLLGGGSFNNVGVPQLGPGVGSEAPLDLGRAEVVRDQHPQSANFYRFAFRVAPLRNVELTAPYMHNGAYATLEAVVTHYNDVPTALRSYDVSQLRPDLRSMYHGDEGTMSDILSTLDFSLRNPINLTDAERSDLVAFLRSLTDPNARDLSSLIPVSVPSGLPIHD